MTSSIIFNVHVSLSCFTCIERTLSTSEFVFRFQYKCCQMNVLVDSLISVYCRALSGTEIEYMGGKKTFTPTLRFGLGGTVWSAQVNLYLSAMAVFRNARWRLQLSSWKLVGLPATSQTPLGDDKARYGLRQERQLVVLRYRRYKRGAIIVSVSASSLNHPMENM